MKYLEVALLVVMVALVAKSCTMHEVEHDCVPPDFPQLRC